MASGYFPVSDSPIMLDLQCKHLWRYGEGRRGRVVQRWRRLLADTIHTSTSWKFATMGYCIAWAREGGGKSQFAFEVWTFEPSASKLRRKVMCLLVTIMKKLVATYPVRWGHGPHARTAANIVPQIFARDRTAGEERDIPRFPTRCGLDCK